MGWSRSGALSWRPCSPRRLPPPLRGTLAEFLEWRTRLGKAQDHKARQQSAASAPAAPGADSPPSPRADNKNAHSSLRAVCARRLLQRARRRPGGGGEHEVSNQPGAKRAGRRARGRRRAGEAVLRPAADVQPVHVRDARRTRRAHPRFNASPCARIRGGSEQREFARPPAPICPAPSPSAPSFTPPLTRHPAPHAPPTTRTLLCAPPCAAPRAARRPAPPSPPSGGCTGTRTCGCTGTR